MEREQPQAGQLYFWWLGQLGYAIRTERLRICIDPFLSDRATRRHAPILEAEMLEKTDYLFGTHLHDDHIDLPVWKTVAKHLPKVKFVVPRALKAQLCEELGDRKSVV